VRAIFSLRCSESSATKIASQMLAISSDEAAAQKLDAIGEVCNIVAGHFKHKIGYGDQCTLTVPTVIIGCLAARDCLEFPATYDSETVGVALDIRE